MGHREIESWKRHAGISTAACKYRSGSNTNSTLLVCLDSSTAYPLGGQHRSHILLWRRTGHDTQYNTKLLYRQLREILLDTLQACKLLNNSPYEFPIELETFGEVIISICYRLLLFRSIDEALCQLDSQSAVHIGVLIFVMTIFLHRNRRQVVDFSLITHCLR